MDGDHAVPASKAETQSDGHISQSKSSDMEKTGLPNPKRKREDDDDGESRKPDDRNEHRHNGKNKYKQRTFQHGSRKLKGNKRKDLGREEYLYVPEIHISPISLLFPVILNWYAALTKQAAPIQIVANALKRTKPSARNLSKMALSQPPTCHLPFRRKRLKLKRKDQSGKLLFS
jgi:hypothetical protein